MEYTKEQIREFNDTIDLCYWLLDQLEKDGKIR